MSDREEIEALIHKGWRVGGHVDLGGDIQSRVTLVLHGTGMGMFKNSTVKRRLTPDEADQLARELMFYANTARQVTDAVFGAMPIEIETGTKTEGETESKEGE